MKVKGKKELVKLPSVLPDKRDEADSVFLCRPMQSARRVLTIANFINATRDSFQARFYFLSIISAIIHTIWQLLDTFSYKIDEFLIITFYSFNLLKTSVKRISWIPIECTTGEWEYSRRLL